MDEAPNIPEFSVSELSLAVRRTLEDRFQLVRVRGEISGFKVYGSGHAYFDLKDENAVLAAVMWKGHLRGLGFRPEDGLEVIATGKISSYPKSSKLQIIVERLELAGIGALLKQIEDRRLRLQQEGLFDRAAKPQKPFIPEHIGVITSPHGAVIRDILHRLRERFPRRVTLWPTPVQGEGAAARIAAAIRGFNALPEGRRPDLLIVARGGGSIEDLMPFNEEEVVRAAAASAIPLISAVGHETDTTLIDYASSLRAPTPSAAAEVAVPVRAELLDMVAGLGLRASQGERRARGRKAERLQGLALRLPRPQGLFALPRQRLDEAGARLPRALDALARALRGRLDVLGARLSPLVLERLLLKMRALLDSPRATANPLLLQNRIRHLRSKTGELERLAASLAPQAVLRRGFVLARGADGVFLRGAGAARAARAFTLVFADGEVKAHTETHAHRPEPAKEGAPGRDLSGKGPRGQGTLF